MSTRNKPRSESASPKKPDPTKDLWSPLELAAYLDLSPNTVYDLCKAGSIPGALKIGHHWKISVPRFMRHLHGTSDAA